MSNNTRESCLALLQKCRLIAPAHLAQAQAVAGDDPQALVQSLVSQGQLTRWQAQQLLAGRHAFFLGKYKLLDKLGEGGMGAVYKAEQTTTGRRVALKVMSEKVVKQPGAVSRFHREIRAVAALQHPNIVAAFDADQVGETHFLVMEYAAGRDLKQWIKEFGRLPIDWSCECIRQAALGLQHAHERGLAHRDIKPSNILVVDGDVGGVPIVKILDMGLARFTSETQCTVLTQTGQVLGTIDYMSPEQAKDTKSAGIQADIFSLGASLFHLICGQVPYTGKNPMEKLMARAMRDAPRARTLRTDIPSELDDIIARMLARKADDRFQTPDEVVQVLSPFCLGASGQCTPHAPREETGLTPSVRSTLGPIEAEADTTLNRFLNVMGNEAKAEAASGSDESALPGAGVSPVGGKDVGGTGWKPVLRSPWVAVAALVLLAVGIGIASRFTGEREASSVPKTAPKSAAYPPIDLLKLIDPNVALPARGALELGGGVTMEFVYIEPGKFRMGGTDVAEGGGWRLDERPSHWVEITKGYYLGKYEVTRRQFQAFVEATGFKTLAEREGNVHGPRRDGSWGNINGANWRNSELGQTDDHPATCVSWTDAKAFCDWLAEKTKTIVRLPTEAEWEYACRAETTTRWSFGDNDEMMDVHAWYIANSERQAHSVGRKKPNAWGLYDMHGNVWEWCLGYAGQYTGDTVDPLGPASGDRRCLRGGSWAYKSMDSRAAFRLSNPETGRSPDVGFRIVCEIRLPMESRTPVDNSLAASVTAMPKKLLFTMKERNLAIRAAAFSPDGLTLATGDLSDNYNRKDGPPFVKLWDTTTGKLKSQLPGHRDKINAVGYSPDGKWLAAWFGTGAGKGDVYVWGTATNTEKYRFKATHWVSGLTFSPDSATLVAAAPGSLLVWDLATGVERTIATGAGFALSVAFSPEGRWLVAGVEQDNAAKVWAVDGWKEHATLRGHTEMIRCVTFSPDGQQFATVGQDGTAIVWNTAEFKSTGRLEGRWKGRDWEPGNFASFSKNGRLLAVGGFDGSVDFWNPLGGKSVSAKLHDAAVNVVQFSRDGTRLATAASDGTIRLWDTSLLDDPATVAAYPPIDLLKLIDPKQDPRRGEWKFEGDKLVTLGTNGNSQVRDPRPIGRHEDYRLERGLEADRE